MSMGNGESSTIRELAAHRRGRADLPVLLLGSFVAETARVVDTFRFRLVFGVNLGQLLIERFATEIHPALLLQ